MESLHESKQSNAVTNESRNTRHAIVSHRIKRLSLHLNPITEHPLPYALERLSCAARGEINVNTDLLSNYMRGKYREDQQKVYDYFNSRPKLQTPLEISKDEHRELCMRQLVGLVREAGIRPFRYIVDDPARYFTIGEAIGSFDPSLGIKMGVQFSNSYIDMKLDSGIKHG